MFLLSIYPHLLTLKFKAIQEFEKLVDSSLCNIEYFISYQCVRQPYISFSSIPMAFFKMLFIRNKKKQAFKCERMKNFLFSQTTSYVESYLTSWKVRHRKKAQHYLLRKKNHRLKGKKQLLQHFCKSILSNVEINVHTHF